MTSLPTSEYSTSSGGISASSSSSSNSSDSDDTNKIYCGSVKSPSEGVANTPLDPVTVTLERFNGNGVRQKLKDADAHGIVVFMGLASEDGTIDIGPTPKGETILVGNTFGTPKVIDNKLVTEFKNFQISRPGRYRFRSRVFNIYDSVSHLSSQSNDIGRIPSDSLFNELGGIVTIKKTDSKLL